MNNHNTPLVSVIVLTYNQEGTIARTLDSVLNQVCDFQYEVVIGDDASTDSTRWICLDYARRYPNVFLMEEATNKGVVRNYFDCLASCRGKYIADCSGDDFWTSSSHLQRLVDKLEHDPEIAAAAADWHEGSRRVDATDCPSHADILKCHGSLPVMLSAMLYRVDVVRRAMQLPQQVVCRPDFGCEDLPIMMALVADGGIRRVEGADLQYNIAYDTVSRPTERRRAFDYHLRVLKMRLELQKVYGVKGADVDAAMGRRADYLTKLAFMLGSRTCLSLLSSLPTLPVSKRTRLLNYIMKHRTLWSAMRRGVYLLKRLKMS